MAGDFNHKLEFFIGSTRRDLAEARRKLIEAVLEAGHIPSGMELWSSGADPLLDDIARHLGRCDVHIIVLGARYGEYIADNETISFTEWEYRQSRDKRPILAFLLDDAEFKLQREEMLKNDPSEKRKKAALDRFRNELKKTRFCRFFRNTDAGIAELGRLCINSIHQLINEKRLDEDAGWIRANSQEITTLRKISENIFLDRELKRMKEFTIVGERVTIDRRSKEIQSRVFWQTMMGPVRRCGYKQLFFESGSTLAYVSESFENFVLKNDGETGSWSVWTNNVLTILQLLLYTDVNVSRFPPFAPDPQDEYGAIFPREWHTLKERPPSNPRDLYPNETAAISKIGDKMRQFANKALFLATSSGWDLNHTQSDFRGPHVGSHPNMLFKRALFTTGCPVVIFLAAEKLGDPFEPGRCYPIFGPDEPLAEALQKYPLALCIGYDQTLQSPTRRALDPEVRKERNNPQQIRETLSGLGFDGVYANRAAEAGAIIAGNSAFQSVFPIN